MDKEIEKKIAVIICNLSQQLDYSKETDVDKALSKALSSEIFGQSVFGKKYIGKLQGLKSGSGDRTCMFCGKQAHNGMVCKMCSDRMSNMNKSKAVNAGVSVVDNANIKLEDLLKDMGDDMMQLATENSVKTLKKMTWISMGLNIINSIIIIFLAIILWKFMMAQ